MSARKAIHLADQISSVWLPAAIKRILCNVCGRHLNYCHQHWRDHPLGIDRGAYEAHDRSDIS